VSRSGRHREDVEQILREPNGQTRANPAFKAQRLERTSPQAIRAEMTDRYVGA
jgi:hypothetical protein